MMTLSKLVVGKLRFLSLIAVSMLLTACASFESFSNNSADLSTSHDSSSAVLESNTEKTRQFEYNLSLDQLEQRQFYIITYQGEIYKQVSIRLVQSIPDASDGQLADPVYRNQLLAVFEDSPAMQEAKALEGVQVTASFDEANHLVILMDADMTRLNVEAASQLPEFGSIFAGLQGSKPEEFIAGLEALGAKEIQ